MIDCPGCGSLVPAGANCGSPRCEPVSVCIAPLDRPLPLHLLAIADGRVTASDRERMAAAHDRGDAWSPHGEPSPVAIEPVCPEPVDVPIELGDLVGGP